MRNKKYLAALGAISIVLANSIGAVVAAPKVVSVSTSDKIQADELAGCIVSEDASLDVMLLMDASSSLLDGPSEEWTTDRPNLKADPGSDPDGKRLNMIESALSLLLGLAVQQDIPLYVNVKTFGKADDGNLNQYSLDWTEIKNSDSIDLVKDKANYNKSEGTDWLGGLKFAQRELQSRDSSTAKSCQLMIWVTDGVLNPSGASSKSPNTAKNGEDINTICSPTDGYINWFRRNQVLILGGLLEPKRAGDKTRSQIFTAVVEGVVDYKGNPQYFGGAVPEGNFECGASNPSWTMGTVVKDEDPTELAWKFVDLVAQVKSLVALSEEDSESEFFVDNETAVVEIFTKAANSESWRLFDANGNEICSAQDTGDICKETNNGDIITITVDIPADFDSYGDWEFETESDQMKAFGNLEGELRKLELRIANPSNLTDGEVGTVDVSVFANNELFDGEGFDSVEIQVTTDAAEKVVTINQWSGGQASLPFTTKDDYIKAKATLISDSGREYEIRAKDLAIKVVESGLFASVSCKTLSESLCRLNTLANSKATSITELTVTAAENSQSSVLSNFELFVTGSDHPERNPDGYSVIIRSGDTVLSRKDAGASKFTFENDLNVSKNEELPLTIEISYTSASLAQENIEATLTYDVANGDQSSSRELQVVFNTDVQKNFLVISVFALLVYLLSILVPYLILLRSKKASAFFYVSDNELAYVSLPARIAKDGSLQSRTENGDGWEPLKAPHYKSLVKQETPNKSSKLQIAGLTFVVEAHKWNPFADLNLSASKSGSLIVASNGSGAGSIKKHSTTTSQSLQDQFFLIFDEEAAISPVSSTQEVVENVDDPFAVSTKSRIEHELSIRTSDLEGTLLLITQTFGNKPKLLAALIDRVNAEISGQTILEEIQVLRETELEEAKNSVAIPLKFEPQSEKETVVFEKDEDDWFSSNDNSNDDPFSFDSGNDDFNFGSSSKDDDWKF